MQKIHRHILFSFLTGSFFSLLFYFGTKFLSATFEDRAVDYSILDFLFIIPIIIVATLIFYFLFDIKIKWKEDKKFNLKHWQIFVPLMLVSTITFLAFLPGHYPYDSSEMYKSFQASEITNHYSPLVTVILGLFLSAGKFFGSEAFGHAAFVILQFVFLNLVLTKTIFYCSEKLKKKSFGIILTIFFTSNPLIQTLLIRSGQDTIFGGIFLLLTLEFLKISEDEKYFSGKKKYLYLFVLIFFLCATRNNGLYAIIPVFIFSFFIFKNYQEFRKKFFIAISLPIVFFLGYNYLFINNVIKTKDSFFRETLNIPIMQIARAMYFNSDENFKEELKTYFKDDCDTWMGTKWDWSKYNYSAGISDPAKNCMKTDEIDKNPMKFFDLWKRIGEKYTLNYIEAPLVFTLGLYHVRAPYNNQDRTFMWHKYIDSYYDSYGHYGIANISLIPPVQKLYDFFIDGQIWSDIPILHILWGAPFTVHLTIITILFSLYRKKYKYLLPLLLIFGLIITVVLSPVMLFRYIFPAVICLPIIIYILKSVLK